MSERGLNLRRGSLSLIRQPPPGLYSHVPPHAVIRLLDHCVVVVKRGNKGNRRVRSEKGG